MTTTTHHTSEVPHHTSEVARDALSRLVDAAWGRGQRSCFSTPARPQFDADLILEAVISERDELRGLLRVADDDNNVRALRAGLASGAAERDALRAVVDAARSLSDEAPDRSRYRTYRSEMSREGPSIEQTEALTRLRDALAALDGAAEPSTTGGPG